MFGQIRDSLRTLLDAAATPADRRAVVTDMKATLVQARLGAEDLRGGVVLTRTRLANERRELETLRRRRDLAAGIGDGETVTVAERFERQAAERERVLAAKLDAQEQELALVEREVAEMSADVIAAARGVPLAGALGSDPAARAAAEVDAVLGRDAALGEELSSMQRAQTRAARDAAADDQLAALKRRMGKQP